MNARSELRVAPRRHRGWRRASFACAETTSRWLGGRALYAALFLTPPRLRVREERIEVAGLPPSLGGLCLAQLSDFHAGAFMGPGSLARVVECVNEQAPDVVLLTGDFITHDGGQIDGLISDLGRLKARLGIFAVFGNHDYRGRREGRIAQALAGIGVRVLRNECARVGVGGAATLAIVGLEDLEEARAIDLEAARSPLRPGDVEVVLCHNPSRAVELATTAPGRAAPVAIFAGHTHGTQVDWPWLRRLGPADPGARVHLGSTRLIAHRGLGAVGLPLRVGAPAECVVVRLSAAGEAQAR